jgi:hypothetical protein
MSKRDLLAQSKVILGKFPNAHCYTKRMTEHLLSSNNIKGIPIIILRPSILGAALNEPVPGWTDTTSFMHGVTLLVGLGILTQIPCKQDAFVDIIPVDYVVKQILISIPYLAKSNRESGGKTNFFITSCSTSSQNSLQWREFFDYMTRYQNMFPYEKRAGPAQITLHPTQQAYQFAYKYKAKYPTEALYYVTRVFGSKQYSNDVKEMRI